jgi:hypothetical protein
VEGLGVKNVTNSHNIYNDAATDRLQIGYTESKFHIHSIPHMTDR